MDDVVFKNPNASLPAPPAEAAAGGATSVEGKVVTRVNAIEDFLSALVDRIPTGTLTPSGKVKAGVRTSELWLTVVGNVCSVIAASQGVIPQSDSVWFGLGSVIAYTLSRAVVKVAGGS